MAITLGFVTIRSISSCILVLFLERLLTLKWMKKRSFFNRLAVKLDKFEGEKYSSLLLRTRLHRLQCIQILLLISRKMKKKTVD